jgi:hypothetical protein
LSFLRLISGSIPANEPKTFVTVAGGGHNDFSSPAFLAALDMFLGSLPPRD